MSSTLKGLEIEQSSVAANGQQESSLGRGILQAMSTKRDTSLISRLQDNIYGGVIVDKIIVSENLLEIF